MVGRYAPLGFQKSCMKGRRIPLSRSVGVAWLLSVELCPNKIIFFFMFFFFFFLLSSLNTKRKTIYFVRYFIFKDIYCWLYFHVLESWPLVRTTIALTGLSRFVHGSQTPW